MRIVIITTGTLFLLGIACLEVFSSGIQIDSAFSYRAKSGAQVARVDGVNFKYA